jgi:hypothetical protein
MNELLVAEEVQAADQSRLRRSAVAAVKRWLREPLLHFLLFGAILFVAYGYFEPRVGTPEASKQIRLTSDELLQLATYFQSQWRRPPTMEEFSRLVDDKVREEVLYREAIAMGLDREDTIVKRRMAQKMQFLAEDVATQREPDRAELEAWFAANAATFALPGRITFRQVYFSPDRRGDRAQGDAEKALAKLAGQPVDSKIAASVGDPFMLQEYYGDRSPDQIAKEFGPAYARAVFRAKPDAWQGPIESGFGWHLVFVDTLVPGRIPPIEEIESDVKSAWLAERKASAWQKAYKDMRAKYTVLLPAPPDEQASARIAATPRRKEIPASSGEGPR